MRREHRTEASVELCHEARRLLAAGATGGYTALRTGLRANLVYAISRVAADAAQDRRGMPLTAHRWQQIVRAIRRGWSVNRIVVELHCSRNSVAKVRSAFPGVDKYGT